MKARLLGIIKFVLGSIGTILAFYFFVYLAGTHSSATQRPQAEFLSIPAVFAIIGLIEFIAGVPFYRVSAIWQTIDEWKRWTLSLLFIGILCALIFSLLIYYLKYS